MILGVFHQVSRISSSEIVGPSPVKSEIAVLLGISNQGTPSFGTSGSPAVLSTSAPASIPLVNTAPPVPVFQNVAQVQIPLIPVPSAGVPVPTSLPSPSPLELHIAKFFPQPSSVAHAGVESINPSLLMETSNPGASRGSLDSNFSGSGSSKSFTATEKPFVNNNNNETRGRAGIIMGPDSSNDSSSPVVSTPSSTTSKSSGEAAALDEEQREVNFLHA